MQQIQITGILTQAPVLTRECLEFTVLCQDRQLRIVRLDPKWQVRDILFLTEGQSLDIIGTPSPQDPEKLLARKITIRNFPLHRLSQKEKEAVPHDH